MSPEDAIAKVRGAGHAGYSPSPDELPVFDELARAGALDKLPDASGPGGTFTRPGVKPLFGIGLRWPT